MEAPQVSTGLYRLQALRDEVIKLAQIDTARADWASGVLFTIDVLFPLYSNQEAMREVEEISLKQRFPLLSEGVAA